MLFCVIFTADVSAYATPLPEIPKQALDENDWRRVRQAVLAIYA